MKSSRRLQQQGPVPLEHVLPVPEPDGLVDGVPVKTYRGPSLADVAPRIRADFGDSAMILRQREGVTGGIGGFFAKRCIEVDVAIMPGAPQPAHARFDAVDGPSVGPVAPGAFQPFAPPAAPAATPEPLIQAAPPAMPAAQPDTQPPPVAPAFPGSAMPAAGAVRTGIDASLQPGPGFAVTPPTAAQAQSIEQALRAEQAMAERRAQNTADVADAELPFDAGSRGVGAAPVQQGGPSFEERLRTAGLTGSGEPDPAHVLAAHHEALVRRGVPEQIASPVVDDTLCHRLPLEPGRDPGEVLAAELARRIPTFGPVGRVGQTIAFVGTSGAGKTRAIARLAAAYGASSQIPVACVSLQGAGSDGALAAALAAALAPYGVAVHAAPDAPRALDRITALRRNAIVLVDTPGVSPGDRDGVARLAAMLQLLELDTVALCLPVVLAAPIARRVLRALRPLRPTAIVATHADEADLLGGVVAVAIDRRVPLAYISGGAGRGQIASAEAHRLATQLVALDEELAPTWAPLPSGRTAALPDVDLDPLLAPEPTGPTVDVAAGASHLAPPWVSASLRDRRR